MKKKIETTLGRLLKLIDIKAALVPSLSQGKKLKNRYIQEYTTETTFEPKI